MIRIIKSCPVTCFVGLVAVMAWWIPESIVWLELDFAAVRDGQWWRIWTGHWTHFGGSHLFWDLVMFVALGSLCERMHRNWFGPAMVLMSVIIGAAIAVGCPEIGTYRGLSGIDTGLFVWFATDQAVQAWRQRRSHATATWSALLVGLAAKLTYETATGQTLFVDSSAFVPLVMSHLAGALAGLGISIAATQSRLQFRSALSPTLSGNDFDVKTEFY